MSVKIKHKTIELLFIIMLSCCLVAGMLFGLNIIKVKADEQEINKTQFITNAEFDSNYKYLKMPNSFIGEVRITDENGSLKGNNAASNIFDGVNGGIGKVWDVASTSKTLIHINFSEKLLLSGFIYTTRSDNNIYGTMSYYKCSEETTEGETTLLASGESELSLGVHTIIFEQPISVENLILESDAQYIAELSFLYIPFSVEDINEMMTEVNNLINSAESLIGYDLGRITENDYNKFLTESTEIKELPTTTEEEQITKAKRLINLASDIKRSVLASIEPLVELSNEARNLYNAAAIGSEPLYWQEDIVEEFKSYIDRADKILKDTVTPRGELNDMVNYFQTGNVKFKNAFNKPNITISEGLEKYKDDPSINTDFLMDGVTATRIRISPKAANYDGTKYLEFDYQNEINFDSITVKSWWASRWGGIKTFKLEYWDTDNKLWKPVKFLDSETADGLCSPDWQTNSQITEAFKAEFDTIETSKIRFYFIERKKEETTAIDEIEFGVRVPEEDMTISLNEESMEIFELEKTQLIATVGPFYASNKNVTWSSSDPDLLEVDQNGNVIANGLKGNEESREVTITVTTEYGSKSASCKIIVKRREVSDKDQAAFDKVLEIEQKFLSAAKASNYQVGAIDDFRDELNRIVEESNGASAGALVGLMEDIKKARNEFNRKSLASIQEIRDLIDRVAGAGYGDKFTIEFIPAAENGKDVFEVDWQNDKPVLRGNTVGCLATAFNYYLKYYCYQEFPYTGSFSIDMPKNLPRVTSKYRNVYQFDYRHYSNENCEYKYTVDNYTKNEWRHRLDWMAMNGFNMYLVDFNFILPFYEMALDGRLGTAFTKDSAAMQELKKATLDYSVQFGNHALSDATIEAQMDLASYVVKEGYGIGLSPEIRPFFGMLPFMFPNNRDSYYGNYTSEFTVNLPNSVFDGMKVYSAARWMGMQKGVAISPYIADQNASEDEKAKAKEQYDLISDLYYEYLFKVYGFDDIGETPIYFMKDLVQEMGYVVQNPAYPREMITYVNESIKSVNPYGKFVMSSWRFAEWELEYLNQEDAIVIDLDAFKFPRYSATNEFWGTTWAFSCIINYGGNNGLAGHMSEIAKLPSIFAKQRYLNGFAIAPEGGDTDPATYALLAEMTWRPSSTESIDVYSWLKEYAKRRYGAEAYQSAKKEIDAVWDILYRTVYSNIKGEGPDQSVINAYPKLEGAKARTWGTNERVYDLKVLVPVWKNMLDAAKIMGDKANAAFKYDLVDFTRQILGDFSNRVYQNIAVAYNSGNKADLLKYGKMMVDIALDMDELLNTNSSFMIGTRLEGARSRGVTPEDKAYYEELERTFLTIWVPDNPNNWGGLLDYCNKQMGGIMKDYYAMRWQEFYKQLEKAAANSSLPSKSEFNGSYMNDMQSIINQKVMTWVKSENTLNNYGTEPIGDTYTVSSKLYDKYISIMNDLYEISGSANKTDLQAYYDNYKDTEYDEKWDLEKWNEFRKAISNAEQVLGNDQATASDVYNATLYLQNTYSEMMLTSGIVDKSQLIMEYERYVDLEKGNYTTSSWNLFQDALKKAKTIIDKEDATLNEINQALTELRVAYEGLKEDSDIVLPPPDKTTLIAVYEMYSQLNSDDYTEESWNAFQIAFNAAKTVIDNPDATNAEVNTCIANLEAAYSSLVRADQGNNSSSLGLIIGLTICGAVVVSGVITFAVLYLKKRKGLNK